MLTSNSYHLLYKLNDSFPSDIYMLSKSAFNSSYPPVHVCKTDADLTVCTDFHSHRHFISAVCKSLEEICVLEGNTFYSQAHSDVLSCVFIA